MIFKKKVKYYNSIDEIPIWNYWKFSETDDFKYLVICDDTSRQVKFKESKALKAWDNMTSQYIDFFGVNNTYKEILMLNREIILNEYIWEARREPISKVYAREAKKQLESLENNLINSNPQDQVFYIEKEMGFRVDIKQMSVKEFYSYVSNINKYAKEIKKQNNGKKT